MSDVSDHAPTRPPREAPHREAPRLRTGRRHTARQLVPPLAAMSLLLGLLIIAQLDDPGSEASINPNPQGPAKDVALWVPPDRLRQLPTTGPAWRHIIDTARRPGAPGLGDLGNKHHANVLAMALVAARHDDDNMRSNVRDELAAVMASHDTDNIFVLGPARKMTSYVVAADVVGLTRHDRTFDAKFRSWITTMRSRRFNGGGATTMSIVEAHETRPNNFGTVAGASRVAIDAYLDDRADLQRAATIFRGWLGDTQAYDRFVYGPMSWQDDPTHPVGINPPGATARIGGEPRDIDGVLPDDQRQQGPLGWPPVGQGEVYMALQGAVAQAELLHRQGYDAWTWSDRALLRAMTWLYTDHFADRQPFTPRGTSAEWILPLVNARYGTDYDWTPGFWRGSVLGYTDWTHAGR